MAKSLEETLKDLRAGGYSEGSVRNWLVNKGFPAAKVDKAVALRSVKDVTDSKRARLHRALDCVLDRSAGRDAELGRVEARISPQLRTLSLPQLKATLASYERKAANVTSSAPDWNHINRVLEELDDEIERRQSAHN